MQKYYRLHRTCLTKVRWFNGERVEEKKFRKPIDAVWCAFDLRNNGCSIQTYAVNGKFYGMANYWELEEFVHKVIGADIKIRFLPNTLMLIPARDGFNAIEIDRDKRIVNGDLHKFHKFVFEWFIGEPV